MQQVQSAHRVRKSKFIVDRLSRAAMETLEDRRLLATISGVAFDDLNQNQVQDPGELPLANQLVYVDTNTDGDFDEATRTYTSVEQPPLEIADMETTDATMQVANFTGTIKDIDVTLNLEHGYISDLQIFLISPGGTSVELLSGVGGSGTQFTGTILDDAAATSIIDGTSPFTGIFKPEGLLSTFNNENPNGTWRLRIVDTEAPDGGFLNSWSLTINNGLTTEPNARTDANGAYSITGLPAGQHTVRSVVSSNRTFTTPAGGSTTLTLTADEVRTGVNFGSYRPEFQGAGLLDVTFDTDGVLQLALENLTTGGEAVAVQDDGKIVVGGWADVTGTTVGRQFFVARLNLDGTLDTTFGGGTGYVLTDFTNGDDEVRDLIIQGDGKIIAAGRSNGNFGEFAFARYDDTGALDTTFGVGGKTTVDLNPGLGDVATGLALQGDGKIVATGTSTGNASPNIGTVRLNADGTPDITFAGTGRVITDVFGGGDAGSDVIVDADGNIVVVGAAAPASSGGGTYRRLIMLRYLPNGQFDTSFGGDGKVDHDYGVPAMAKTIVQQADGKYVIGGIIDEQWTLARFNSDGSADTTFGTGGKTTVSSLRGIMLGDMGMAVQSDGKFLLGGHHQIEQVRFLAAARFLPDGTLDPNFGLDGIAITNASGEPGRDLVLQNDGKILLVGGEDALTLVRYANDLPVGPTWVAVADGVLTLTGTENSDAFTLSHDGTQFTAVFGTESIQFDVAAVTGLRLSGLDGDDVLTLDMTGGNVSLASLTIDAGNGDDKVRLSNGDGKVLTLGGVPALNGESLDLGTADLQITDGTLVAVEPLLLSARGGAVRWQGPGIGTSAAGPNTGLALIQPASGLLVKFTYNGDANGDGLINADDYFRIDSAFLSQPASPTYGQGDFNFDDTINADDYFLIDSAFLGQTVVLGGTAALSATASGDTASDAATSFVGVQDQEDGTKRAARRGSAAHEVLAHRTQRRAPAAARRGR